LVLEKLGDPAGLDRPASFCLPRLGRLVEEVAHHLPANDGVPGEQPLDDRVARLAGHHDSGCYSDIIDPTNPTQIPSFRPGTGTWAYE
jgi:hypothetical protein